MILLVWGFLARSGFGNIEKRSLTKGISDLGNVRSEPGIYIGFVLTRGISTVAVAIDGEPIVAWIIPKSVPA